MGESLWNWGTMLQDAVASGSSVGASCLLCIPVLPLPGALQQAANPAHPQPGRRKNSPKRLSLVEARGLSSHPLLTDNRLLCLAPPQPLQLPPHLFQAKQALGFSILSGRLCFPCRLGQGFLEVFKSSHELAAGGRGVPVPCRLLPRSLPDHTHLFFETCWCQPCFPPLSHPPAPFWWSPSSSVPKPAPTPCRHPGCAGNETCAQRLPPAGCHRPCARWDNIGSSPAGSLRVFAAQRSRAGSWRKSEELVRENLGKGKGKKKISWNLARSYASFHEKSNVAIAGPRLCWSSPRPLPGSEALPMPTQLSAESQPSLVPWPQLRLLHKPLLPPLPLPPVPRHPGSRLPLIAPVTYLLLSV